MKTEGTVLVVDDEEIIREVAKSILEANGYQVLMARDGLEALDLFRAHQAKIQAVLLDVTMPRLDGAETFLALREIQPGVRIVFSSGFDNETVVDRFVSQRAVGFLQKPYRAAQLVDQLRSVAVG